jgi:hypothetical protein
MPPPESYWVRLFQRTANRPRSASFGRAIKQPTLVLSGFVFSRPTLNGPELALFRCRPITRPDSLGSSIPTNGQPPKGWLCLVERANTQPSSQFGFVFSWPTVYGPALASFRCRPISRPRVLGLVFSNERPTAQGWLRLVGRSKANAGMATSPSWLCFVPAEQQARQ